MKNSKFKLICFIFLFIFLIPSINAGNTVDDCNVSIDMNEIKKWATGYNVRVPICDMNNAVKMGESPLSPKNTYAAALATKDQWIKVEVPDIAGKDVTETWVKRCDRSDIRVEYSAKCTYTVQVPNCYIIGKKQICSGHKTITYEYTDGPLKSVTSEQDAVGRCNSANGVSTCSCSKTYTLYCPVVSCVEKEEEIQACAPTFHTSGDSAYCVNPNQGFAKKLSNGNNYMEADFNVDACETSYSTVDCGFANILIESAWQTNKNNYKISDHQTQLALRLWGAHSGQAGYDQTGLANVYGENCNIYVNYIKKVNIYKETHDYIWKTYLEKLSGKDYVDASEARLDFEEISCSKADLGVICGIGKNYLEAYSLFFNTVLGNKYMHEHLNDLVGLDVNTRPTNAVIETVEETSRLELSFERSVHTRTEETYNCNDINDESKYPELTSEQRDYISNYCDVKVEHVYVVDTNGNKTEIKKEDVDKFYDSKKGTLVVEVIPFAVCEVDRGKKYNSYQVIVNYKKTTASRSVKKYVACTNNDANQILYAFDSTTIIKEDTGPEITEDIRESESYDISINCTGQCNDYSIRSSEAKCSNQKEYNKYFTGYVKDPSLSCIINMASNTNKNYYDYSEHFKVNTNLCRVYCSDEVDYYIAGRVNTFSGFSFKYDIKPGEIFKKSDNMLTSIVEEKRRCVSEIYYENEFKNNPDWKGLYGITDKDLEKLPGDDKQIRNWRDLFFVLFNKSLEEGQRTENLNEIIWDLYNCNFVKDIPSTIRRPKNDTIGNLYDYMSKMYSKNYGLVSDSDVQNTWIDNITYSGGAEYVNSSNLVGTNTEDIDISKDFSNTISEIKYCSGFGYDCLEYNSKNEKYTYDDKFGSFKSDENGVKIVSDNGNKYNKELKDIINTKLPTNDYAMFEITTQIGFYNSSKFEIEAYTGNVNKIKDNENSNYTKLDDYSYPMSKNAYNRCTKNGDVASCPITQKFNNISLFYRNRELDSFVSKVKSNEFTKFDCSIDVNIPEVEIDNKSSKTIYRNVDLTNLFPNNVSNKTNWFTENGINAKNDIEESAESISRSEKDYLEYSIELTPEVINNIKLYNASNTSNTNSMGYINNTLKDCTIENGIFINCKSDFLQGIRNGSNNFGIDISNGKYDGISEHTKVKEGLN